MPYGYNRDAETLNSIGQNLGTIVGTFIQKRRLKKSRLALEREEKLKQDAIVGQKSSYLKQQLGPDDTDLYNQLTENPTPESLALAEPEILRRSKLRADKAKTDAEAQKQLDEQAKAEEKLKRKSDVLTKIINDDESVPAEQKSKFLAYIDGTEEGYDAAKTLFTKWKPEKEATPKRAELRDAALEDILMLGNNDIGAGLELARKEHPELYREAIKYGIKADKAEKQDDPAAQYIEQIQRDFTAFKNKTANGEYINADKKLPDFARDWLNEREQFIPVEAKTAILDKIDPTRNQGGLMKGMKDSGFVGGGAVDPDAARAEDLSNKLHATPDQMTDEELDWLDQYRKSKRGTASN